MTILRTMVRRATFAIIFENSQIEIKYLLSGDFAPAFGSNLRVSGPDFAHF